MKVAVCVICVFLLDVVGPKSFNMTQYWELLINKCVSLVGVIKLFIRLVMNSLDTEFGWTKCLHLR